MTTPALTLSAAIRSPKHPGSPAIMPYVTSGWPTREGFGDLLVAVSQQADAIEVGVPFSDPMADGPVIQRTSREAIEAGTTLPWILQTLAARKDEIACPTVLMSYLNPLLAHGIDRLVDDAFAAGVSGFIVPDLPLEEATAFDAACARRGLARIALVTPVTPDERLRRLTAGEGGFVYAVTVTGITGGDLTPGDIHDYLARVRAIAGKPVCAGFGIRRAEHVAALAGHADGCIVGTAFLEALGRGDDPQAFVAGLRGT